MAASIYLGNNILNHFFRGQTIPVPEKLWVSLHTSDAQNAGTEVKTSQWPSYTRLDANLGNDGVEGAFKPSLNKITKNARQLLWPPFNGTGTITIKDIALWTAPTDGQQLAFGTLSSAKTLSLSDEIVIHVDGLTIQVL